MAYTYTFRGVKQNIATVNTDILRKAQNYKIELKAMIDREDLNIRGAINRMGYKPKEIEINLILSYAKINFNQSVNNLAGKLKGFVDSAFQKGEKEKLYDEIQAYAESLEKEFLTLEVYTDYLAQFEEKEIVD
jgi:hypothetical protein